MITEKELQFVREALELARQAGAQKARATLSKSEEDLVATLDGEVDRVTHCADRSLSLALFVDGRFGSYSTNKLERSALEGFIRRAVAATRMVAGDPCRDLPDPARCCRDAVTGDELGLVDPSRDTLTPADRQQVALDASVFAASFRGSQPLQTSGVAGPLPPPSAAGPSLFRSRGWLRSGEAAAVSTAQAKTENTDYQIISEEGEYSDSIYETVVMDTNGLCCAHSETSFDYGVEITVERDGEKYSGYWWDSSPKLENLEIGDCGLTAMKRAVAQFAPQDFPLGRYNMVVENEVAGRLLTPVLNALNGSAIQQQNSFLADSLGKKVFPDNLTVIDCAREEGR
ncbi:MAG: hypothetical protein J5951_10750, partial [Bacteroidales bacterium]|nr:hypothetical protein [Bacteroidales bacterium]